MWDAKPSIETIRKARRYAANYFAKRRGDHYGHSSHLATEAINAAGKRFEIGHGCEGFCLDVGGRDGISYLNMGDTYDLTILFDSRTEQFRLGSWGDLVERLERQGITLG